MRHIIFIIISIWSAGVVQAATLTLNIRAVANVTTQTNQLVASDTPILFQAVYDSEDVLTEASGVFGPDNPDQAVFGQSVIAQSSSFRAPELGINLSAGATSIGFGFFEFRDVPPEECRPEDFCFIPAFPGNVGSEIFIVDRNEASFQLTPLEQGDGHDHAPFFDLTVASAEQDLRRNETPLDGGFGSFSPGIASVRDPAVQNDPNRLQFTYTENVTIEIVDGVDAVAAEELALLPDVVTPEGAFEFFISEALLAGADTIWIDPEIAVGYTYAIENAKFATVTAPSLVSVNDPNGFLLSYSFNGQMIEELLLAEETYRFLAPVDDFIISGIDTALMLDPADTLAFRTGFTATDVIGAVSVRQQPITIMVDDDGAPVTPIPLPAGWALLISAVGLLGLRRRRQGDVRREMVVPA